MASVLKICLLLVGLVTAMLGVLMAFFPLISFYPYLGAVVPSTYLKTVQYFNHYSNPFADGFCYSTLSPFAYENCPNYGYALASPFDTLPLLPAGFVVVGLLTVGLSLTRRPNWLRALFLSMSAGLILVLAASQFGYISQGWPIRWVVYPIHHVPGDTYEGVILDVVAFAANWAIFTALALLVSAVVSRRVYHSWRFS